MLNRLLHLALDLKVTIRRAQSSNPLVRPLVIVITNPPPHPLLRLLKTQKLRPGQKLLKDRLPKTLYLPERHRMMRG
jgi:hypothetical protein